MKVMLLFPPNWTPTMPHLALPTLTAYLRQAGVEVLQRDLNVEVFDEILTSEFIENTVKRLQQTYNRANGQKHTQRLADPPKEKIQWALANGEELAARVDIAKDIIRSQDFFDGPAGRFALETITQCLEIASLPFYPASLTLQTYSAGYAVDSSKSLLQAVRDPQHNLFLDIYRRGILQDMIREQPDVIGISIPSMPQMLPGLTLGYLIREAGLKCHITIGGPHISMLRDELPHVPDIFELFDSAVVFDGEVPLLQLVQSLAGDGDLSSVPNLIYRTSSGEIRTTDRKIPERIENLPLPDFHGLPLDRYLAPHLALPLMTARGCYFGKCAFCNVGYGEAESFSELRATHLADQMQALADEYGIRHIFFADEAVTPRNLRELSRILIERETDLHWGGCVRFEKVITAPLLNQIHAAGCRMILFGLESASQPIIDLMVKGTRLDHMHRILEESNQAGIWNHTFFFFGFPGETIEDAQATVDFIYAHKEHIHSAAMGTFLMERYSPAHRFPQSFRVKKIIENPDQDLAIYFDYEVESGMDNALAEKIMDSLLDVLPTKPYPQFYMSDVYRFLYASHLNEQDEPLPPWLAAHNEIIS